MKKLVFSIIAVVAFSFAGMANNGEVKEVEILNNKEIVNNESVEEVKSCGLQYLEDFERLEDLGLTFQVAADIAFYNFQKCAGLL